MPLMYLGLREYERQSKGSDILEEKERIEFKEETKEEILVNL